MAHKKLTYRKVFKCLLQVQGFIPLNSRLSFFLNYTAFRDLIFIFKEGLGATISVFFSYKMKAWYLAWG